MHIVHVTVQVKPTMAEAFVEATLANAKNSLQEPGVARFDILRQQDDPARFVLVEVYRTAHDAALHKETAHYLAWRERVAPLMEAPRSSTWFVNVFPADAAW